MQVAVERTHAFALMSSWLTSKRLYIYIRMQLHAAGSQLHAANVYRRQAAELVP